jgi:twitching motility protein PilT
VTSTPEAKPEQTITLPMLLKVMVDKNASDLHLTTHSPPLLRIDGSLIPLKTPPLTAADTKQFCYSVVSAAQQAEFEKNNELDFSFGVKGLARFRGNMYLQRGSVAGAFRQIPFKIRTVEELLLPEVVRDIARRPRGMVLVTGPTGSGKSTTLAAIIDLINTEQHGHIITIEDPIEYMHPHKNCMVNQREIGTDTKAFKTALKYALRQDPDVVLVGEMRDLETIESALTISETGHLTFGTLHTNTAISSISRIIDVFPPHQQQQVRSQLSMVLEAVISQTLLPKIGGGVVVAPEILILNSAVRNLIREEKLHQVYTQIQVGRKYGMQTMNQAMYSLIKRNLVRQEDAMESSSDPDELRQLILQGNG